jgi:hypothetical protein
MKTIGITFIVLGCCMLIWTGFNYTKKEKIIDAGPVEIYADKEKTINWSPYLGVVLLVGGIAIFSVSKSYKGKN